MMTQKFKTIFPLLMKTILTTVTFFLSLHLFAQVTIKGTIKNPKDSVIYFIESGGFHNITQAWRDKRVKTQIDSKGHFNVIVPEYAINSWMIKTANGYQLFDLIKGNNLELIADFAQPFPLRAIGKNADDFNYSSYAMEKMDKNIEEKYLKRITSKNIDSVLFNKKEYASIKIEQLEQYKKTHLMSDTYYKWLNSKYSYEPYEKTIQENVDNKDSMDNKTFSKLMEKGIHDEYAALNTVEYNYLIRVYMLNMLRQSKINRDDIDKWFKFSLGNILKGNTRDIYLSRFMALVYKLEDSIYMPLFERYNKTVKNKFLKQHIIDRRNEYINAQTLTHEFVSDYGSLNKIFEKYRGKIMYVDFWASWCVPCRADMPNAAILKKKLEGKNVVFIYLGYNDKVSPWQKARKNLEIEGEHYLLNDKMIKEAEYVFGINGIPHYAIIDKKVKL